MEVRMRRVLDYSKPINTRKLKPKEKVVAAVVKYFMSSQMYKNKEKEKEEKVYKEQIDKDEMFKRELLMQLHSELDKNITLGEKGIRSRYLIVSIDAKYEDSVLRVLGIDNDGKRVQDFKIPKVFLPYSIERVEENKDVRLAIKDLPILLRCSTLQLGGVEE